MDQRSTHSDMQAAEAEFREASRAALSSGAMATQPLTVVRMHELCALGERMMRAEMAMKAMKSTRARTP
ncbi:MAG: hypothetical protein EOO25_12495 [Comamonadaceae bacterium]|nr:MAG: hypothetical protein EOO25_12495 [Comamonadaceae bacterium]